MLKSVRRVVTGHDAQGRSIVISDGLAPLQFEAPHRPGSGNTTVWCTKTPADNEDEGLLAAMAAFPEAGSGGVGFVFLELPPESELDSMPPARREAATMSAARLMPSLMEVDISRHYGMHATDTLDLVVVLAGELTMLLDDGEVVLKPFETVVQRGTNHGWVNRGKEPALIAAVTIDAKPLARKRPGKRYPKGE